MGTIAVALHLTCKKCNADQHATVFFPEGSKTHCCEIIIAPCGNCKAFLLGGVKNQKISLTLNDPEAIMMPSASQKIINLDDLKVGEPAAKVEGEEADFIEEDLNT